MSNRAGLNPYRAYDAGSLNRAEEDSLKMKNQELISGLKTPLTNETNAVIDASKKAFEVFKQTPEGKMRQFNAMFEKHKKRQKEMKINEQIIIKHIGGERVGITKENRKSRMTGSARKRKICLCTFET
jgi:hypothetical protein